MKPWKWSAAIAESSRLSRASRTRARAIARRLRASAGAEGGPRRSGSRQRLGGVGLAPDRSLGAGGGEQHLDPQGADAEPRADPQPAGRAGGLSVDVAEPEGDAA